MRYFYEIIFKLVMPIIAWQLFATQVFAQWSTFPNPFNPISTITFDLPTSSSVQLKVYDVFGQEVATILDNIGYNAGSHSVEFDASWCILLSDSC